MISFVKRYLVEKTSLKLLISITIISFLLFILCGFSMTFTAVINPEFLVFMEQLPFLFLFPFMAAPIFFYFFFTNLARIFYLFKQEKERNLSNDNL